MNMSLHNIKEIKVNTARHLGPELAHVRKLTVVDKHGNEFEINLFADDINELTIKSEI